MKAHNIVKYVDTYSIPVYAVCALENGDYTSFGDSENDLKDIENIKKFEERISKETNGNYIMNWDEGIDDPYFTHQPEFGLATDAVDMRLYRIYDEATLERADIDGKNLSDDFEWLTGYDTAEEDNDDIHTHRILFWNNGCVVKLEYQCGYNKYKVVFLDDTEGNINAAKREITKLIHHATDDFPELYNSVIESGNEIEVYAYYIMEVVNGKTENEGHC